MTSVLFRAFRNSFIYTALAATAMAAPGDVDSSFLTGIGVGMTGPQYPNPQGPTGATQALGIQSDGKILVGSGGGMSRHNNSGELTALKRLLPDGTLDPAFAPNQAFVNGPHTTVSGQVSEVNAILVNEDGSFFIGGVFEKYGSEGESRTLLAKVNSDGTLNATFIPPSFSSNGAGRYVQSLALDANGGLLVGGAFSTSGKLNLVRLDASTGAVDPVFDANAAVAGNTRVVDCVTVANDGRLYISGTASSFPMAKRLFSGGQEDNSFIISFANDYGRVNRILPLPNGRVILGGNYDLQGTPQVDFLTAHTSSGTLDNTFMGNLGTMTNGWVGGLLKLLPDGRILAGGIYNLINGTPIASLAILSEDGVRDTTFTPVPYSNVRSSYVTHIYDAVVQPDGKIVAGGWFSRITDPGLEITNLVRFEGEAAAGAGRLKFSSTSYSLLENAVTAKVQVARVGGISGAVSVSYTTGGSGSTAVAGTDYTTTSGTLNWADGEAGAKTISIPITNNAVAAAAKTLRVTISSPTGGASLGTPAQTTVNLLDDDSAPSILTPLADVTLNQGATLRLSVVPDSPLPVTYQWQYNGSGSFANISGATSRELIITQVTPTGHAGQYRVLVTNANGTTTSTASTVTVLTPAGSLVPTFNSNLVSNRSISPAVPDGQGRWIVVTNQTASPSVRTLQRLLANGTVDTTFIESTFDSSVSALHVLADGRIMVGGFFDNITSPTGGTVTVKNDLARFQANGALDTAYSPSLPAAAGSSGNLSVYEISPAASGGYYVGFGSGGGLRRYLADGSVDTSFTAPATIGSDLQGYVSSMVELSSGKILVAHVTGRNGSGFTYNLVRLNADGSADSTFNAVSAIGGSISAVHVFAGGQRIAIGGGFAGLNGAFNPGPRMALLDASGNADTSFVSPFANNEGTISKILDQGGKLVIAGSFSTIGGQPPRGIARLRYDGSVDPSFVVGVGTNGNVNALYLTADNNLFIAGNFTQVNGIAKNYAAVLLGNLDVGTVGFSPSRVTYTEAARTISLDVLRYGSSTNAISVQWATADAATGTTAVAGTDYTAALGTLTWAAGDAATKTVTITLLDDNMEEVTKNFRVILSEPQGAVTMGANATITLLDSDTPASFTTQPAARTTLLTGETLTLTGAATSPTPISYQWYLNGAPVAGATSATLTRTNITQAQGGLYILVASNAAGGFSSSAAQVVVTTRSGGIADGQATAGRPVFTSGSPQSIVALADGSALIGGFFTTNVGSNLNQANLIRVLPSGATDTGFTLAINNTVRCFVTQPDGKILIGGDFTSPASRLMRLNADLTPDTTFNTNVSGTGAISAGQVNDVALDSTGRVYVAVSSGTSGAIARFSAAGERDSAYTPAVNQQTLRVAVQADDKLLVSGFFTQLAGSSVSRFGRLNTDGTRDTSFTSTIGGNASINDLLVLKDGRIFAAGSNFSNAATMALVNTDGSFGSNMGSGNQIYQLSQAPNGKVVIARASSSGSGSVSRIKASNPLPVPGSSDGDTTFNVGTGPNADVKVVSHGADGSIWIAGDFTTFNGITTGGVVKLIGDPGDPGIVNPPVTVGVNAGATAQLSVGAVGTNLTYQWLKNGAPLADGGRISGATSAVLTIANVVVADDDLYTVAVTGGTTVSTVTSAPVRLNVLGAPVVVTSPPSVTPALGSTVTLAADVLAATPATYEWRRDGVLIINGGRYSGANTATLVIANATGADTGSYVLKVTNTLGTASTTAATVTLNQVAADRDSTTLALGTSSTNSTNYINNIVHLPDGRTLLATRGNVVGAGGTNIGNQLAVVETDGRVTAPAVGNFNSDGVNGFCLQPDGKILVYGNFTQVGGQSGVGRTRIARLNADLTLDSSFVAVGPFAAPVNVVVDAAGRIYLAGGFNNYGNQNGYTYMVRLNPDGTLDSSFKPNLSSSINQMLMQPDGKILIGGYFSSYNPSGTSITVPGLLRFNADGSVDSSFTAGLPAGSFVKKMAVDSAGRILVARENSPFTLLRLTASGAVDSSFNFTETLSIFPSALTVLPSGKILVGGQFSTPRNGLFQLNENGSLDTSFNVGTGFNNGGAISAIEVDLKGRIWISGTNFTQYNGAEAKRLVILQGEAPTLQFITQPQGRVVDLGTAQVQFSSSATGNNGFTFQWNKNGTPITDGGRFSGATTGTLTIANIIAGDAAAYTVTVTSPARSITSSSAVLTVLAAPQVVADPQNEVVAIGGTASFTGNVIGAAPLSYQWLRFGNPVSNGGAISGANTPTLIIAGADFTHAGNYSLRVTNGLGTITTATANLSVQKHPAALAGDRPQPTFAGDVNAIHMFADGSYLVGGSFDSVTVNGTNTLRGRLARFNSDGTLDTTFAPSFNNTVSAIAVDSSGRVFVGGNFTSVFTGSTTVAATRVVRFTSALVLDTTFNTVTAGPTGPVNALAPLDNGSVYIGGSFTGIGAVNSADVRAVARLSADGSLDTAFKSQINVNAVVHALMRRGNKLLIGAQNNAWGSTFGQGAGVFMVSATGALDSGFTSAGATSQGMFFKELADGNIFAGQNAFGSYAQRYNATTGAVLGFTPNPGQPVLAAVQQGDGKLVLGGQFTTELGSSFGFAQRLYRSAVDGTVDTTFSVGTGFNNKVSALAMDVQGRIYVGGSFTTFNGVAQNRFAILNGGNFESRDGLLPPQTIAFAAPANRTFNPTANTFTVSPMASSGLPVTVAVTSGPATITGNTVTITGAGQVTLTATQAGNASFAAAPAVVHTFTVSKAAQTITFNPPNRSISNAPFDLTATATSGLTVSYEFVSGPATLSGSQITLNGTAGTVTVRAVQSGDANWEAAPSVERSFQVQDVPVEPEPQSITFGVIANRDVEDGPLTLAATASSGLPVTFTLVSGPATLTGNVLTPTGATGTVVVRAEQAGDAAWLAASPVTRSFLVTGDTPVVPVAQTLTFVTPANRYLDETTLLLDGYASSGLPVVYEVSGPASVVENVLTLTGTGTVTVTATQPGNEAFLAAKPVVRKIKVLPEPTKLTLTNLVQTYTGTPRSVGYLGVEDGTDVTITYAGSATPPTKVGKYAVLAVAGSTKKTGTLVINKAPLFVTVDPQRKLAGTPNPELTLSYSGFLAGDTEDSVFNDPSAKPAAKRPTLTTTAKETSAGGEYPIKATGAVAANYTFAYTNGILTVDGFAGKYEALLTGGVNSLPVAKVEITVANTSKTYTGKLTVATETAALAFKGSLTTNTVAETTAGTATLTKGGNTYVLNFTLPIEGSFTASLENGTAQDLGETTTGQKLFVLAKGEKLAHVGAHTLVLAPGVPVSPAASAVPVGAGHATASVDAKGVLKIAGKLADGTTLTAALAADSEVGYRLFALPYKRIHSYIAGSLALTDHPDIANRKYVSYASATDWTWAKAEGQKDKSYRSGFGPLRTRVTLDPWLAPNKDTSLSQRLGLTSGGDIQVFHSSITSPSFADLPTAVSVDAKNKVSVKTPAANATKWTLTVTPNTGAFKGSFTLSDAKPRKVSFTGVLRQPPSTDNEGVLGAGNIQIPALPTDTSNEVLSAEIQLQEP